MFPKYKLDIAYHLCNKLFYLELILKIAFEILRQWQYEVLSAVASVFRAVALWHSVFRFLLSQLNP